LAVRKKLIIRILSAILVLGAIYWFGLRTDPRVDALNQALHNTGSPALLNFAYEFRVVRLDGESAVLGTPRSPEVPVYRMIGAIYPNLAGKATNDPEFVAAEKEMAQIQSEARQIILGQPGVTSVKWELDRNWLIAHNISLN
jgi:hypothetical protein